MILADLIDSYNEDRQAQAKQIAEFSEHLRYYANNQLPQMQTPVSVTLWFLRFIKKTKS